MQNLAMKEQKWSISTAVLMLNPDYGWVWEVSAASQALYLLEIVGTHFQSVPILRRLGSIKHVVSINAAMFAFLWADILCYTIKQFNISSSPSTITVYCGPQLPIKSSSIPAGLWPLYTNFLFQLPLNPRQSHRSSFSVVFLFCFLLPFWQSPIVFTFFRH